MSQLLTLDDTERQVNLAKAALNTGNYGAAIQSFFLILQRHQGNDILDVVGRYADDLVFCLNSFGDDMVVSSQMNSVANMTWMWMKALELSRYNCKKLLCSTGIFFLNNENYREALKFMELSLAIDPSYLPALQNLEIVRSNAIDRWHFRMLNDKVRNDSYFSAIKEALRLRPNGVVYDIGAGSGILSVFAAMNGASKVYCCEVSSVLAYMAQTVVNEHKLDHLVTVINQISYDVQLPEKVDIIVTELVDSGLLGEHIIPVLSDSVKRFLKDDGIVIPYSADVYGYPFESNEIHLRQRVSSNNWESNFEAIAAAKLGSHQIRRNIESPNFVVDDSYSCEDATSLPHKALSEPLHLGNIIFKESVDSTKLRSVNCKSITNGLWHGFLYWFDLNLLPPEISESSIVVSTAPGRKNCGWDQAILFTLDDKYYRFQPNEDIILSWRHDNDRLYITSLSHTKKPFKDTFLYPIGEMDVASINNILRTKFYVNGLLDAATVLVSKSSKLPRKVVQVTELCAAWESICVETNEMLSFIASVNQYVVCVDSSISEYLTLRCKNIRSNEVTIFNELSSKDYVLFSHSDIFVLDIVGGDGCLCHGNLKELALIISLREEADKSSGSEVILVGENIVCVPSDFSLIVSLLECPSVLDQFRLDPTNISMDTTISEQMNIYGSRFVGEIDLQQTRDAKYLSTPVVVHRFNVLNICRCSYSTGTSIIECSQSGRSHGIAVWYLLESATDSLLTGPPHTISLKQNSHYRQLIILFDNPIDLKFGDHVKLNWELDINYGLHIRAIVLS